MIQYCPNSTCVSSGGVCMNDTDTCQCPPGKNNDPYDKYLCKGNTPFVSSLWIYVYFFRIASWVAMVKTVPCLVLLTAVVKGTIGHATP